MRKTSLRPNMPLFAGYNRTISILLWITVSAGLAVSTFTVIEEMCLATACRDTASFTIFGAGMGWFGIAYFVLILMSLWLRKKIYGMDWGLNALVFAGIGAELRLLWIQKYIIGSWCPLCVTICCTLLVTGILLLIEKVRTAGSIQSNRKSLPVVTAYVAACMATGFLIALVGVKALT